MLALRIFRYAALVSGAVAAGALLASGLMSEAHADNTTQNVVKVCPMWFMIQTRDYSQCKSSTPGDKVTYIRGPETKLTFMAIVCDANDKNCYTGYVDVAPDNPLPPQ